jgi:cytochrome b
MKSMKKAARWLKRHGLDLASVGIGLLILATLEARSAWGAFTLAPHEGDLWWTPWGPAPRAALQHAVTSVGFGLMAFVLWRIAAGLKDDERARIRSRA